MYEVATIREQVYRTPARATNNLDELVQMIEAAQRAAADYGIDTETLTWGIRDGEFVVTIKREVAADRKNY